MKQLKNLIQRSNVPISPKNNMNAADDFLNIIILAHVIALAMRHFKMQSIDDLPAHKDLDLLKDMESSTLHQKQNVFHCVLEDMLRSNVTFFTTN